MNIIAIIILISVFILPLSRQGLTSEILLSFGLPVIISIILIADIISIVFFKYKYIEINPQHFVFNSLTNKFKISLDEIETVERFIVPGKSGGPRLGFILKNSSSDIQRYPYAKTVDLTNLSSADESEIIRILSVKIPS